MEKKYERTLVTAALPYANGPVHIGHLAGVYIPADIYVRYLRARGERVIYVCGSDEHGVPVTIRARKEGISVQEVVDRYHNIIKDSFRVFGISFDVYGRTTSPTHHKNASDFFSKLHKDGKLTTQVTEQFYDEETGRFLTDRNIRGECPRCHHPEAYGDQCESCGATLSPEELINPYNAETGNPLVRKATKHWYLPLDENQEWLERWILQEHKEWRPNVYGQCKSWLDGGLRPRAVTRDLDWGIAVPLPEAEGKVLYVWFDAPIGYISNTIDLCHERPELGTWQEWWQDKDTRLIHFIGKDNIVFHCIVFPTMLKEHGDYILPDNVPSNEFLNLDGNKISTSKNYAVWLNEYLEEMPERQDELRYVLTANAPETKDNDFTWADYQARCNNELVAVYGNFVNRALQLTQKYYDGKVPECDELTDYDRETLAAVTKAKTSIEQLLDTFKFREAQREAMNLARVGNKYIADCEPWKVVKTAPSRVRTIIYLSLQITANLAIAFQPFLPFSSERLRKMLAMDSLPWEYLGKTDIMTPGKLLPKPSLLFAKVEDSAIEAQVNKLQNTIKANEATESKPTEIKPTIAFDDFQKLDIRVGTVVACEPVHKMKKLLRLKINDGSSDRTIVSGISKWYEPADLVGKQLLFVANLAPRKFKDDLVSEGMILTAQGPDGNVTIVAPEKSTAPGSTVS